MNKKEQAQRDRYDAVCKRYHELAADKKAGINQAKYFGMTREAVMDDRRLRMIERVRNISELKTLAREIGVE